MDNDPQHTAKILKSFFRVKKKINLQQSGQLPDFNQESWILFAEDKTEGRKTVTQQMNTTVVNGWLKRTTLVDNCLK